MLIYSSKRSPRLDYVISFAEKVLQIPINITEDKNTLLSYPGPKINYSESLFGGPQIWIKPSGLLFEQNIKDQEILLGKWKDLHTIFHSVEGSIPFDMFSGIFYLISRYEEYLPHPLDEYGRYAHADSIAFREGFLKIPLIDLWLLELRKMTEEEFPEIGKQSSSFTMIPTYDIDIAYSFLGKGFIRNIGGTTRDFLKGKWAESFRRLKVLLHFQKDPFDCYDELKYMHINRRNKAIFFFHVGMEKSRYDRNLSPKSKVIQKVIKHISHDFKIGVHPSWLSNFRREKLIDEIEILAEISGKEITASRQHYIKFKLPNTFRELIRAGITEDYSMGYGSINGFRASTSYPHYWYDLEREMVSSLKLFPFSFMDANAYYEERLSAEAAIAEMKGLYGITKKVGGHFISIWHNNFLGSQKETKSWRTLYFSFMEEVE